MGRRASQQSTFTKGSLDPDLSERLDLEAYYDSLADAENTLFHPQGGFSARGGFRLVSDADILASGQERRLRRRIAPVVLTSGMITAANGGTAANLVDQNAATVFQTNAVTSSLFVLFEIDLGVSSRIDAVDLLAFSSELLGADEAIVVQVWTGTAWVDFAGALDVPAEKHIRTTARTRRFSVPPGGPGGVPVMARQLRLVARDCVGVGRVSIGGVRLWYETMGLSPVRVRELARDDSTRYKLVYTERNIDVFEGQRYVASVPVPVAAQQVRELGIAGGFDTVLLFNEMIETPRIMRQGSAAEWNVDLLPYEDVPPLISRTLSTSTVSSTNSKTVALGALSLSVTGVAPFSVGQRARATSSSSGAWMEGVVTTASGGIVAMTVDAISGSGTYTDWKVAKVTMGGTSAVFSSDQDEIQDIAFPGAVAGDQFAVFLGDLFVGWVIWSTAAAVAATLAPAIGALPGVSSTVGDVLAEARDATTIRIRFAGGNGSRMWPLVSAIAHDRPLLQPATSIVQEGHYAAGVYCEARTGWPRAGMIVEQRLMVAGFRAAPTSYMFSVLGALYDFSIYGDPLTADKAFAGSLDISDVEIIYDVVMGQHLQVFTKTREFWASATTLSATAPLRFVPATKNGMARGVPLLGVDGATLYMQAGGQTLREFQYNDAKANYDGDPLSVLCPHIIADVVDAGHRPSRRVSDGNLVMLVNGDGTMAAVTTLKKQQVIAGSLWRTDGAFRSVCCGVDFDVVAVVERGNAYWLEAWAPDIDLDFCTSLSGSARTVVSGCPELEGRSDIWAIADGEMVGPLSVSGGSFTLPFAAEVIAYGLAPAWVVRGQVTREKLQQAQPFRAPGRIYEVGLSLRGTGQICLGTNGQAHAEVSLLFAGDEMADAGPLAAGGEPQYPMMERLFTGTVTVGGLLGVTDHPYWELSRTCPAPVHVKAVRWEISDKGD